MRIVIKVKEIKGKCPIYSVGDKIVLDGPRIVKEESSEICVHALVPILHFYLALREGVSPEKIGIGRGNKAYISCPDPGKYTGGGNVIFELEGEEL